MRYDTFVNAYGDACGALGVAPLVVAMNNTDWRELMIDTSSEAGANFGRKVDYSTDSEGLVRLHGCALVVDDDVVAGRLVFWGIPEVDKFKLPALLQHNRMFLQRALVREMKGLSGEKVGHLMREWKGVVE